MKQLLYITQLFTQSMKDMEILLNFIRKINHIMNKRIVL